jgi:hypothetical protein
MPRNDRASGGTHMTRARLIGFFVGGLLAWALIFFIVWFTTRTIGWWVNFFS